MAANLHLDKELIIGAQKLGRLRSKRATVGEALREYVQRRRQFGILRTDRLRCGTAGTPQILEMHPKRTNTAGQCRLFQPTGRSRIWVRSLMRPGGNP
ncbi:MAG: type II toxin-antitoxin system VapB family antitoxin [Opitutaceae bacterium]|nr:type II toxin-antitoxin system VapB family antitoxin [Opitutaceae bacterium]